MKKSSLLAALGEYREHNACLSGEKAFLSYLMYYIRSLDIQEMESSPDWKIEPYLVQIVLNAYDAFRNNEGEFAIQCREQYEEDCGHEVYDLLDVKLVADVTHGMAIAGIRNMLECVTGNDKVVHAFDSYMKAQSLVLQQHFTLFLRQVYQVGLYEKIKDDQYLVGRMFGSVELLTQRVDGNRIFTFIREKNGKRVGISLSSKGLGPTTFSLNAKSVRATFEECISMIDEVISVWELANEGPVREYDEDNELFKELVATTASDYYRT